MHAWIAGQVRSESTTSPCSSLQWFVAADTAPPPTETAIVAAAIRAQFVLIRVPPPGPQCLKFKGAFTGMASWPGSLDPWSTA